MDFIKLTYNFISPISRVHLFNGVFPEDDTIVCVVAVYTVCMLILLLTWPDMYNMEISTTVIRELT